MGITIANRDLGLRTDGRKPKRIGGYLLAEEGKEIMNQVNDLTEAVIDLQDGTKRVAATATADGLTTGLLTGSDQFVTVTAEDPNHIITLPLSTGIIVGTTIEGYVGANGFELRVDASEATTATINGVTTNVEAAIPAATYFVAKLVAARKWLVFGYDQTGSNFAIIPDAV